jgi:hypothetical protein
VRIAHIVIVNINEPGEVASLRSTYSRCGCHV